MVMSDLINSLVFIRDKMHEEGHEVEFLDQAHDVISESIQEIDRLQAELDKRQWVSVEVKPKGKVIARYFNDLGNERKVFAQYLNQYEQDADCDNDDLDFDYCEEKDAYYWPAGWYERIDNWEDMTHIIINYEIVDYLPLSALPTTSEREDL